MREQSRVWNAVFAILGTAGTLLSAQTAPSRQKLDALIASSDQEVRTGNNLKMPPGGDWHVRYKESDFPVVQKVDDNVFLYQMPHPTIKGWLVNSLIVVTTDGVVLSLIHI